MVHPLSTILESGTPTMGGQQVVDTSGAALEVRIWSVTGLTAAQYARSLETIITGALVTAGWGYTRLGGCG